MFKETCRAADGDKDSPYSPMPLNDLTTVQLPTCRNLALAELHKALETSLRCRASPLSTGPRTRSVLRSVLYVLSESLGSCGASRPNGIVIQSRQAPGNDKDRQACCDPSQGHPLTTSENSTLHSRFVFVRCPSGCAV